MNVNVKLIKRKMISTCRQKNVDYMRANIGIDNLKKLLKVEFHALGFFITTQMLFSSQIPCHLNHLLLVSALLNLEFCQKAFRLCGRYPSEGKIGGSETHICS